MERGYLESLGRFDFATPARRVLFGAGRSAEVAEAVAGLGGRRALVLATPGHGGLAAGFAQRLGGQSGGVFAGARMHTPAAVTAAAMVVTERDRIDCLVAVGGGSAIGLAKAIAFRTNLPLVAVPTTYAGSEMTDILGETLGGAKTTRRSETVRPGTVIYDVELTLTLPPRLSAASGLNAIAHAVEALYARDGNPVVAMMAEEGIRALAVSLPAIVTAPADVEARVAAQYGAWLCGMCLGSASMALHHKLCHVLGGSFGLPHAETHAVVLPHAAAYNRPAAPALARAARALGAADAAAGLHELARRLGVPRGLGELGMPEDGIDAAAEAALVDPYWNPRPLEPAAIRALIADAWAGRPPGRH